MSVIKHITLTLKFIIGGGVLVVLLYFMWLLAFFLTSSDDKNSPYNVNCRNARNSNYTITDDTLMRLSSLAIYDELKEKGDLDLLSKNSGPQTLYHMYLKSPDGFEFTARHHKGEDPRRFTIHLSYQIRDVLETHQEKTPDKRIGFRVDYQDCGPVKVYVSPP